MFLSLIRGKQDIRPTRKTAQGTAVTDSYLCAEVVSIPVTETWTKWHVDNYYMCNVFPCFSVAQCLGLFATHGLQHTRPLCPSPSHEICPSSQVRVHCLGDTIQPPHPLTLSFSSSLSLPRIRVFSSKSALLTKWPKYWSFSFSISPFNKYSGLIFRMDWLDLLAVQWTLGSLLQYHSSKASILWCSAFFMIYIYIYIYI